MTTEIVCSRWIQFCIKIHQNSDSFILFSGFLFISVYVLTFESWPTLTPNMKQNDYDEMDDRFLPPLAIWEPNKSNRFEHYQIAFIPYFRNKNSLLVINDQLITISRRLLVILICALIARIGEKFHLFANTDIYRMQKCFIYEWKYFIISMDNCSMHIFFVPLEMCEMWNCVVTGFFSSSLLCRVIFVLQYVECCFFYMF